MLRVAREVVATIIRTIFDQPNQKHVNAQADEVLRMLEKSRPEVAAMLGVARLTSAGPVKSWRPIWSPNPMERINVNKEIKRCTAVVGVFPNSAALIRLAGRSLSSNTTSGKPPTAATFSQPVWPPKVGRHL